MRSNRAFNTEPVLLDLAKHPYFPEKRCPFHPVSQHDVTDTVGPFLCAGEGLCLSLDSECRRHTRVEQNVTHATK